MDNSICDRAGKTRAARQLDEAGVELLDELEDEPAEPPEEPEPEPDDEDVLAADFESPPDDEAFDPGAADDVEGVVELVEDRLSLR